MQYITLLRVEDDFLGEALKLFETIEEFQTYMNEHYKSYWKYEIYNCTLREDDSTNPKARCW